MKIKKINDEIKKNEDKLNDPNIDHRKKGPLKSSITKYKNQITKLENNKNNLKYEGKTLMDIFKDNQIKDKQILRFKKKYDNLLKDYEKINLDHNLNIKEKKEKIIKLNNDVNLLINNIIEIEKQRDYLHKKYDYENYSKKNFHKIDYDKIKEIKKDEGYCHICKKWIPEKMVANHLKTIEHLINKQYNTDKSINSSFSIKK